MTWDMAVSIVVVAGDVAIINEVVLVYYVMVCWPSSLLLMYVLWRLSLLLRWCVWFGASQCGGDA